jgi:hypothetical protein
VYCRGPIVTRHLRFGFAGIALFAALGLGLETLHAFKVPFYLDAGRETTRLLLRLAHAHGTLLAIVNVLFGLTVKSGVQAPPMASPLLLFALVTVPGGFFLGALWAHGGDPGIGVVLVPLGAIALIVACVRIAHSSDA